MNTIRKFAYSKIIKHLNRIILSIFYDSKYLRGKYFDNQRYGFVWAWLDIPALLKKRRLGIKWPVTSTCRIPSGKNITFANSSLNIFQQPNCYFQNYHGHITIGENVWIAQNVGIITENHNPLNPDEHLPAKNVEIGDSCWIGMNAVILPGVKLGPHTIVGAGSIVTHSFEGKCIIAGNPAKIIKKLDDEFKK